MSHITWTAQRLKVSQLQDRKLCSMSSTAILRLWKSCSVSEALVVNQDPRRCENASQVPFSYESLQPQGRQPQLRSWFTVWREQGYPVRMQRFQQLLQVNHPLAAMTPFLKHQIEKSPPSRGVQCSGTHVPTRRQGVPFTWWCSPSAYAMDFMMGLPTVSLGATRSNTHATNYPCGI